jgi:hypothetical protein
MVCNKSDGEYQSMIVDFKVPPEFVTCIRKGTHDIQLRIFQQMPNAPPIISYPSYFEILLDKQLIGLNVSQRHISTNNSPFQGRIGTLQIKKAVLSEPLMLGSRVANNPNKLHMLNCRWKNYAAVDYKICIAIVHVLSVEELYGDVMERAPWAVELTRKKIFQMFGDEDGLMMDNFRESLTCPVSYLMHLLTYKLPF